MKRKAAVMAMEKSGRAEGFCGSQSDVLRRDQVYFSTSSMDVLPR
jgi:hypothetical protein